MSSVFARIACLTRQLHSEANERMTMENDPSPSSHNGSGSSSSSSRHARAADAQAHDGSQRSSRSSSSSKGRKRGFLENSNLTDQDRRQVRWKERELYQDIRENASELATLNSQRFQATTDELEEMYEDVCYPREANLDASNLDELNMAVAKQSQSLGASDLTKSSFERVGRRAAAMGMMKALYGMLEGTTNIYTLDHRGTGRSFFLNCRAAQAFTPGSVGSTTVDFLEFPNCVKDVLFQIDNQTAAFSVTSAAKDIEYVINNVNTESDVIVYGASYGTYLVERVMHLAPPQVRGYILDGVVSEARPTFATFSSDRIPVGKHYASLCEKDPKCLSKYAYGVKEHGDLHSAWVNTYKKLDDAKAGAGTCADLVSGTQPTTKPSMLLRGIISSLPVIPFEPDSPEPPRDAIPALFRLLDRCEKDDMAAIRAMFLLQSNETLQVYWDRLISSGGSPSAAFDEIGGVSPLLDHLIKASEMWTFPSMSIDTVNKKLSEGVFAIDSTDEYAYFCMLQRGLE
ncbi:hypothetical protein PINS_up011577 [Pythium insidiosum]|nr:hypothetical protein PINS_up011577 [Pythium insidiosum]